MTPNHVTLTSALFTFGALAAVALVEPSWTLAVLVYAALVTGFAFDSADGQLARLTGRADPTGSGWTTWWTAGRWCSSTPPS